MTPREFQDVRDALSESGLILEKSHNLTDTLIEMDMVYPFDNGSIAFDSITGESNKLIWKEMNRMAKKLSAKLNDKVHADDNQFSMHYSFKVTGKGKGEAVKYLPFTLEFDDGQVLTALVKNIQNFKTFKMNREMIVTHFMLNKQDITEAIYLHGDTNIDMALTVGKLKRVIEGYHTKFISKNPIKAGTQKEATVLMEEISAMVVDLGGVVDGEDDNKELSSGEKFDAMMQKRYDNGTMRDVKFDSNEEAEAFAVAWGRYTTRGHTIEGNYVTVDKLTDDENSWIDNYLSALKPMDDEEFAELNEFMEDKTATTKQDLEGYKLPNQPRFQGDVFDLDNLYEDMEQEGYNKDTEYDLDGFIKDMSKEFYDRYMAEYRNDLEKIGIINVRYDKTEVYDNQNYGFSSLLIIFDTTLKNEQEAKKALENFADNKKAEKIGMSMYEDGEISLFPYIKYSDTKDPTAITKQDLEDLNEGFDNPAKIVEIEPPTYTVNLPSGTEKYISIIREEFAKDEKLSGVTYAFAIDGVVMDSIDKKSIVIGGGDKAIQTHMKKIIHFITIGADKIEGKPNTRMPSADVIRNAEYVKEKTGVDYTIEHHQSATFLTAREAFEVGADGRGSNYLRPIGKHEYSSIKERWLMTDASRKTIVENINEALEKDRSNEADAEAKNTATQNDNDTFNYDKDAVDSKDLVGKNTEIIRNWDELSDEEQKVLTDADRWDMLGNASQFVAYGKDGRASIVGIYGNVKDGSMEVKHLEIKGEINKPLKEQVKPFNDDDSAVHNEFESYAEIVQALAKGKDVYWANDNYKLILEDNGDILVHSQMNNHYIGLQDNEYDISRCFIKNKKTNPLSIKAKLKIIKPFMNKSQYKVISQGMDKIDYEFNGVIDSLYETITTMPKTYEQDGKGDDAIAYLHYFNSGSDWYITEKDMGDEQVQAFGYAVLNGDTQNAELGYISIEELTRLGVELDFHYSKQTLRVIKGTTDKEDEEFAQLERENESDKDDIETAYQRGRLDTATNVHDDKIVNALAEKHRHTDFQKEIVDAFFKGKKDAMEEVEKEMKNKPTDQELKAQIENSEVYKQILKESSGGVMYNMANAGKYDDAEILSLWDKIEYKDSVGGIMKGAINFLLENKPKEKDGDDFAIKEFLKIVGEQTDSTRFEQKLDEIADLIESKGLMDEYEDELNKLADRLTDLMEEES